MSLDTYVAPEDIYRARGDEVNPHRPLFTGDVYRDVAIPGTQEGGMAVVLAHPCSFRKGPALIDRILVAAVRETSKFGASGWTRGYHRSSGKFYAIARSVPAGTSRG